MKGLIKYAAILVGVGVVYKLFNRGGRSVELPTDLTMFTHQEAQTIADRLYYAMADIGTDTNLLFTSLESLTAQQLIMVYNAFGKRSYAYTGSWFGLGYDLDLFGWFNKELSGNNLTRMKQLWAKTNLTWTI